VLLNAGDQVPVIGVALVDCVGKVNAVSPEQMVTGVKVGMVLGVMVMVVVAVPEVHCPAVGVNVYVPVVVLLNAGDQVPVIGGTLLDEVGKT
jgi:hypothetical protein